MATCTVPPSTPAEMSLGYKIRIGLYCNSQTLATWASPSCLGICNHIPTQYWLHSTASTAGYSINLDHLHVPYLFNLNHIHDSDYDHWPLPLVKPFLRIHEHYVSLLYDFPNLLIELLSVGVLTLGKLRQGCKPTPCWRGRTVWSFSIKGRGRVHHWAFNMSQLKQTVRVCLIFLTKLQKKLETAMYFL